MHPLSEVVLLEMLRADLALYDAHCGGCDAACACCHALLRTRRRRSEGERRRRCYVGADSAAAALRRVRPEDAGVERGAFDGVDAN